MEFLKHKRVIFTVSYGDCYHDGGGTSKAMLSQINIMDQQGISCVNLSPYRLLTSQKVDGKKWLVRCDEKIFAVWNTDAIISWIACLLQRGVQIGGIQVHHLKGVNLDELSKILDVVHSNIMFYIHDYYTICPSNNGNLMVDGILCDIACFSTDKCKGCNNFSSKQVVIHNFIDRFSYRAVFICPSDACKNIWITAYPKCKERTVVIYHQKFVGEYTENTREIKEGDRIKIAFLGAQITIKGWEDFKKVVNALSYSNSQYRFYYFGSYPEKLNNVENIYVNFAEGGKSMVEVLRENKIDCTCLLSKCPETYSYTLYESLAANAFVLAFPESGNIADQIIQRKCGAVVRDSTELIALLKNYSMFIDQINQYRCNEKYGPMAFQESDEFISLFSFYKNAHINNVNLYPPVRFGISKILYSVKLFFRSKRR